MMDYVAEWEEESREFILACDAEGRIVWLDSRAQRRLGELLGSSFFQLAAPGAEEKVRALFECSRREPSRESELAMLTRALDFQRRSAEM